MVKKVEENCFGVYINDTSKCIIAIHDKECWSNVLCPNMSIYPTPPDDTPTLDSRGVLHIRDLLVMEGMDVDWDYVYKLAKDYSLGDQEMITEYFKYCTG